MPEKTTQLTVHVPEEIKVGKYSNAFAVHIKGREVIIDAGFVLPGTQTLEVVNRTIMHHDTAEEFMRTLQNALLDWRNKQKETKK